MIHKDFIKPEIYKGIAYIHSIWYGFSKYIVDEKEFRVWEDCKRYMNIILRRKKLERLKGI